MDLYKELEKDNVLDDILFMLMGEAYKNSIGEEPNEEFEEEYDYCVNYVEDILKKELKISDNSDNDLYCEFNLNKIQNLDLFMEIYSFEGDDFLKELIEFYVCSYNKFLYEPEIYFKLFKEKLNNKGIER